MNADSPEVAYRIDEGAKLVWVDPAWQVFAREHGASELADGSILGESLWSFIEGVETRHLYELMFNKVRRDRSSIVLPFRCDSPDRRRFMELRIGVGTRSRNELELAARLLRAEPRDAVPLLESKAQKSRAMLAICSFCKRIEVTTVGWLEVEEAASRIGLLSNATLPKLSHGVCPDCRGRARDLLTRSH